MLCVAFERLALGAYWIVFSCFGLIIYNATHRNRYALLSLTVSCVPIMSLLRGHFFYHGITTLLTLDVILWCFMGKEEMKQVTKDVVWRWISFVSVTYWWASFVLTGDYYSNSRVLDFALTLTAIYLLSNNRMFLATTFAGIAISTTSLALGLLPLAGERLGMAQVDGMELGNPVLLGVPAALIILLCFAENGRWLLLEHRPIVRMAICIVTGEWLVLSGSRGSWAITLVGLGLILLLSKQDRKPLLISLGVICLVSTLVLSTERGARIIHQFDRSVDGDRSFANRTSGRSIQWEALPEVFAKSPVWGWGPGSGKQVVRLYTGRNLEWHALYLQVIAETGLIGFLVLIVLLGTFLRRGILHLRRFGEIAPLLGVISFMTLGISVQALDAFSGILLGLVFIPNDRVRRYVLGQATARVVDPEPRYMGTIR
jgi:O-antigen ligase